MTHSAENTYVRIISEDHMVTGEVGRAELPMITFWSDNGVLIDGITDGMGKKDL